MSSSNAAFIRGFQGGFLPAYQQSAADFYRNRAFQIQQAVAEREWRRQRMAEIEDENARQDFQLRRDEDERTFRQQLNTDDNTASMQRAELLEKGRNQRAEDSLSARRASGISGTRSSGSTSAEKQPDQVKPFFQQDESLKELSAILRNGVAAIDGDLKQITVQPGDLINLPTEDAELKPYGIKSGAEARARQLLAERQKRIDMLEKYEKQRLQVLEAANEAARPRQGFLQTMMDGFGRAVTSRPVSAQAAPPARPVAPAMQQAQPQQPAASPIPVAGGFVMPDEQQQAQAAAAQGLRPPAMQEAATAMALAEMIFPDNPAAQKQHYEQLLIKRGVNPYIVPAEMAGQ